MAKKRIVVWIHWIDGDVTDTDEITVFAVSKKAAETAAADEWRMTIGADYPNCRIEEIEIPSQSRLLGFA